MSILDSTNIYVGLEFNAYINELNKVGITENYTLTQLLMDSQDRFISEIHNELISKDDINNKFYKVIYVLVENKNSKFCSTLIRWEGDFINQYEKYKSQLQKLRVTNVKVITFGIGV